MSKSMTNFSNLLDFCSEFTKGQEEVQEVKMSRSKTKSKARKNVNKISNEEKEYANYIGYQYDSSHDYTQSFVQPNRQNRLKRYQTNAYNRAEQSLSGVGRGSGFNMRSTRDLPMADFEKSRPTQQELNDQLIGDQLRQMGIGVPSNQDLEAVFQKTFKAKEPRVETFTVGDIIVTTGDPSCRFRSSSCSAYRKTLKPEQALDPRYQTSSQNGASKTLNRLHSASETDISTIGRSRKNVSDSGTWSELSDDCVRFGELKESAENPFSVIQFKIKSNDDVSASGGSRNALINGLLKKMADGDKDKPDEEESDDNEASDSVDSGRDAEDVYNSETEDSPHNRQSDADSGDCNNDYVSSDFSNNEAPRSAPKSGSSSCSNVYEESTSAEEPLYFTAPVSKKVLLVKPAKTYIDIMPRPKKLHNPTLGDFIKMPEEPVICVSPANVGSSNLNPFAIEFSPKSKTSKYLNGGDDFNLHVDEFPPL